MAGTTAGDKSLVFGIKFDLSAGIEDAVRDWDSVAAKIEKRIEKRPVKVKVKLDVSGTDSLDKLKERLQGLDGLKIEPFSASTKRSIRELSAELKALFDAMNKVKNMSVRGDTSKATMDAAKLELIEAKRAAALQLAAQRASRAALNEQKLADALNRGSSAASAHTGAMRNVSNEYEKHSSYLQRLTQRMAIYFSVRQLGTFLSQIREVTAQFELQRVSLGALLQDQAKANLLFSQIKSFALQSPIKLLDLTSYVKQVAAYRIEYDKLFDTTKRLADISVGLGVDMGRIVLAFGQVKAASYLRSAEIRQFTEAGIPMLELLAEYFSKLNGEAINTNQVMDMVEKRMVKFSDVEKIFTDLTSSGGMFYNMQIKQSQTLYGMWAKLGDAASIMFDEIGNTESVNKGIKAIIDALSELMRNWKATGAALAALGGQIAATMVITKLIKHHREWSALNADLAIKTKVLTAAQNELNWAVATGTETEIAAAQAKYNLAKAEQEAAAARIKGAKSIGSTLAAIGKNIGIGIAIAAVTTLVYKIVEAVTNANKLRDALNETKSEFDLLSTSSVRNFTVLANAAVGAADGSKQQREALEELQRTYKDMIPIEELTIERLRAMKGNYDALTQSIREYISEQQRQKALSQVEDIVGKKIQDAAADMRDVLKSFGTFSTAEIERVINTIQRSLMENKAPYTAVTAGFESIGVDYEKLTNLFAGYLKKQLRSAIEDMSNATYEYIGAVEAVNDTYRQTSGLTLEYAKALDSAKQAINDNIDASGTWGATLKNQQTYIARFSKLIVDTFKKEGVAIGKDFFEGITDFSNIDFSKTKGINFTAIMETAMGRPQLKALVSAIQKEMEGVVPSDDLVKMSRTRFVTIAEQYGANMTKIQRYLMQGGESWQDYKKKIKSGVDELTKKLQQYAVTKQWAILTGQSPTEIDNAVEETKTALSALTAIYAELGAEDKKIGGGGSRKEDKRLSILQEMLQTLEKINKEYADLAKKEQSTKAIEDINTIYAKTFEALKKMNAKYHFGIDNSLFDAKASAQSLNTIREAFKVAVKSMKTFKDKAAVDKFILDLDTAIGKDVVDKYQKQIEDMLKDLAERISRGKTAREFFEKMLTITGDTNIAQRFAQSIMGDAGASLFEDVVKQIYEAFKGIDIEIPVGSAIDVQNQRINYTELERIFIEYKDKIIEGRRDMAKQIIENGKKETASQIEEWAKDLQKARDYEQQRVDIINKYTEMRAKVYKSNLPQEDKDAAVAASYKKQAQELDDITADMIMKSENYLNAFQDLGNVSLTTLGSIRKTLQDLLQTSKELSPEKVKAIGDALKDIDKQMLERDFGGVLLDGIKKYRQGLKELRATDAEYAAAKAEYEQQEPKLTADVNHANLELLAAEFALFKRKAELGDLTAKQKAGEVISQRKLLNAQNAVVSAELRYNDASAAAAKAIEKKSKAEKKVSNAISKQGNATDKMRSGVKEMQQGLQSVAATFGSMADALSNVKDLLGIASDSAAGIVFDSAIKSLKSVSSLITTITVLWIAFSVAVASTGGLITMAFGALFAIGGFLANLFIGNKVKKMNEIIEEQKDIVHDLEYQYERLEKAIEKAFGTDYIRNYNAEMANLQAQAIAYRKMADAESQKGKKTDEDKVQEYLDNAQDALDKIADMQNQIAEQFTGTDVTSAARDFAEAWLAAYASFANTTDAIREKFRELIQNMVIESVMGKVVQQALQPIFDRIDSMYQSGSSMVDVLTYALDAAERASQQISDGLMLAASTVEQSGINLRQLYSESELSGISRNIATASEESITGLAAAINTQNYYMSHIDANVAIIAQSISGGGSVGVADYNGLQSEHLAQLPIIAANTTELVSKCERAATACEAIYDKLNKVTKADANGWAVNTRL